MPKRLNPNLAKIHRCYSVEEAAAIWGIHKQTVRNWIKAGLQTIDDSRPTLIHGNDLRQFVKDKNSRSKRPCAINEIYCVKCRKPQQPAMSMVDYVPSSDDRGCLTALCQSCESVINRFVSVAQLSIIKLKLDVSIRPDKNT